MPHAPRPDARPDGAAQAQAPGEGPVEADGQVDRGVSTGLSEREAALLDFERQWWKQPGSKEQAVRERFGVGATRYYQLVNALLEREDALRHDPMLVKRLRRARAQRGQVRMARRLAGPG